MSTKTSNEAHKDQSGVQIFVILFHELPVVLLSFLAAVLEEPSLVIPLRE